MAAAPAGTRRGGEPPRTASPAWRYARTVVALRYVILLLWVVAAVAAVQLPHVAQSESGNLQGFVPEDSQAVQTERADFEAFGFPLFSRTVLVQRDPEGLSPYSQAEAVLTAVALTQGAFPEARPIIGALPVTNTLRLFPSSGEEGTTVVTYVFAPEAGFFRQTRVAQEFAAEHINEPEDAFVGVTGSVPARVEQARILGESLPLMEAATLAVIILIVSLTFRSVAAPVVALATAALAFVVATRITGFVGAVLDIPIPSELEPLILALLLGVVTDYVIFFLMGMRQELQNGAERRQAAVSAAATFGPIIAVAGLTVAAGTAALLVAESGFFRAFGPALAMAILVALIVSVTLVPAILAVFGRVLFWPSVPTGSDNLPPAMRAPGNRGVRLMVRRPVALVVALLVGAGLTLAALPLRDLELGVSFVPSLPESAEASTAAQAAAAGFAPGILSPTVLLLRQDGIGEQRFALRRLGNLLAREEGVAGVVGPGDLPTELERQVLVSQSGDAARFLVVLEDEPLGADAIGTLQRLSKRLPVLLDQVDLDVEQTGLGGDTALARDLVRSTQGDLGRIAVAALAVNLLMLTVFLRALVAPLYLLATSVLALAAALGLMTFVFQDLLGHDGITFYVPFAAAVLLLSLGSDYNIFGVGHIWQKAHRLPLRDAIIEAVPETTRAITAAGITLAASFAMLALVPLRPFRELAFVMAVGILLDAVVVRSLFVPTLLTLVGPLSGWPWTRFRRAPSATDTQGSPRDHLGRQHPARAP